jgi:NADPH:quinone reductase
MAGKYQNQPPFPFVLGAEFAGTVISAPASSIYRPGDRVFGSCQGAYAEKAICAMSTLHRIPKGWTFREAAGLSITGPTSYAALVLRAKIQSGEICLVHAAAGGVGLTAVQIAKAFGAIVIAACSPGKFAVARRFGADYCVDYNRKEWIDQVKGICKSLKKAGVDVVYDSVGRVQESLRVAAWGARILIIGFAGGDIEKVAMNRVFSSRMWLMLGALEEHFHHGTSLGGLFPKRTSINFKSEIAPERINLRYGKEFIDSSMKEN